MAFWRVSGFSTPGPLELILDREEFTLEDILDEDSDLVAECKSLNGRLVAFLRERSTVEQLVRYLVDPPLDADDPKRAYKYPFTACEVLCCEVEAVFNTLLEDAELMQLLFSLLGAAPPLSSKTAGYFGRVVGHLLLRKTNEMMQYLQEHPDILQQLVRHVDTTSIAEIVKRLVGADEQSSVLFLAQYAAWLAETPLVEQLLARLAEGGSADAQANAADILCAIAHTQPSPLASKLTRQESISALFTHALSPAQQVLVPALDVCIALIEPRRSIQAAEDAPAIQEAAQKAKAEAVEAIVQYVPSLVQVLQSSPSAPQQQQQVVETPYGLLTPPLGRSRLKAVELLAVLLRAGSPAVEEMVQHSGAVPLCLQLFGSHPFNNLLHHCVVAMLVAIITKGSAAMLQHVFEECQLLDWLMGLPTEIRPAPLPGQEEVAATKPLLRAGYLGHVTQIASTLESFSIGQFQEVSSALGGMQGLSAGGVMGTVGGDVEQPGASSPSRQQQELNRGPVSTYLESSQAWQVYLQEVLHPRQELENTAKWACGRPTATELAGLDSDNDEYQQAEMELEHMAGMQPVLYHRYHDDDEDGEEEDGEDEDEEHSLLIHNKGGALGMAAAYGTQEVTDGISSIDLNDPVQPWQEAHMHGGQAGGYADEDKEQQPPSQQQQALQGMFPSSQPGAPGRPIGMEDDEVLLAGSDEDDDATTQQGSPIATAVSTPPSADPGAEQQGMLPSLQMAEPPPTEVSMLGQHEAVVGSFALPHVEVEEEEEEEHGIPGTGPQPPGQSQPGLGAEAAACGPTGMNMSWQPAQPTTTTGTADMQA